MNTQPATYAHLTEYGQRAMQTRNRRAEAYARARRCKKAMQLYFIDHAKARKGEGAFPNLSDFQVRVGLDYDASEYAIGRFGELSKRKA